MMNINTLYSKIKHPLFDYCLTLSGLISGLSYEQRPKRSYEYKIKKAIRKGYDKTTRPVRVDNSTVMVYVAIALYHILDTVSTRLIRLYGNCF